MSKTAQIPNSDPPLRTYPVTWKGEAVFACLNCQRKLKRGKGPKALRKVGKWFRKRIARSTERPSVSVLGMSCVDVCPKNGVTILSPRQLARQPAALNILRSEADLEKFYCEVTDVALFPENETLK